MLFESMMRSGNVVLKTGLIIHNKYSYLAGSPDGLVVNERIGGVK